jgi:hypothetical protein
MYQFLLAAGSTLLKMDAEKSAADAEKRAGAADLTDASLAGHFREKGLQEKWSRTSGTMRARAGASGVAMEGSALEVLMNSAAQAGRDLYIARHVTSRDLDNARSRMERGDRAEQSAVAAGMLDLASTGVKYKKDLAGRYKPPDQGVTEQDWMKEYGND